MAGISLFDVVFAFIAFIFVQQSLQLDNNRIYNCYADICNLHSYSCSQKTATCRYCKDNTYGPYCNLCKDGYYGNATASKLGCKRCPCPYLKSNGTCLHDASDNSLKCFECKPGYFGPRCDNCERGYYKNLTDGFCRPCNCHGNGNESLQQQCDPKGGRCVQCFHRTKGMQCEQCILGYYLQVKNHTRQCVKCNCNQNSVPGLASVCDWSSGFCHQCTHNTTGVHCEKCAHGYKGDALGARNCTLVPKPVVVPSPIRSKHVVVALISALAVIICSLLALVVFFWWKRRKAREPLGFITINVNHADEDDYNIAWIDPVTGDPIRHHEADTDLPLTNGNVELHDDNDDDYEEDLHGSGYESRDTDRML